MSWFIDLDKVQITDFHKIIRCKVCNGFKFIKSFSSYTSTGKRLIEECYFCNGIGWIKNEPIRLD